MHLGLGAFNKFYENIELLIEKFVRINLSKEKLSKINKNHEVESSSLNVINEN